MPDNARTNWIEQYQIKEDERIERDLNNRLRKLIEQSENTTEIRKRIESLQAAEKIFKSLHREGFEYDKEEEKVVKEKINELWTILEERNKKQGTDHESWQEYELEDKQEDDSKDKLEL